MGPASPSCPGARVAAAGRWAIFPRRRSIAHRAEPGPPLQWPHGGARHGTAVTPPTVPPSRSRKAISMAVLRAPGWLAAAPVYQMTRMHQAFGDRRRTTHRIDLPVARRSPFLEEMRRQGAPQQVRTGSQDRPYPAGPDLVHRDLLPGRLRLCREHPRPRWRSRRLAEHHGLGQRSGSR